MADTREKLRSSECLALHQVTGGDGREGGQARGGGHGARFMAVTVPRGASRQTARLTGADQR